MQKAFSLTHNKTIEQSPLVTDFATIWNKLRETYRNELSQLAFSAIPGEKDIYLYFLSDRIVNPSGTMRLFLFVVGLFT